MTQKAEPIILRTAVVWGTTVLAVRQLDSGESLALGDTDDAVLPKPEGTDIADWPVRAVGQGWELDARGASGGVVHLRGRPEDPAQLSRAGAPIPIVAGDHGLLQYGSLGVFFQFSRAAPRIRQGSRFDWVLLSALLFALVSVGGGLALLAVLTTPRALAKPTELTSAEDLAVQFMLEEETPPMPGDKDKGKGIKDPGAKDKQDMGGGKKAKLAEGALGRKGPAEKTEMTGDIGRNLGGMSEVLSSEVGEEVQKTLGSIASVSEALGGLRSDRIVLGRSTGLGMKGGGPGGGGDTEGVPFGAGTLDTGWGPGRGGGLGGGRGGPGGRGRGGPGRGGDGDGEGAGSGDGTGEHKVAGGAAAKAGQGLTKAQINRVVMSRYGAFRACYESAASRNPSLRGGVTVSWSVTPGGSVTGARISNSSLGNARVEGCILRQFRRLRFPTADKATGAVYPFLFKPGKK